MTKQQVFNVIVNHKKIVIFAEKVSAMQEVVNIVRKDGEQRGVSLRESEVVPPQVEWDEGKESARAIQEVHKQIREK